MDDRDTKAAEIQKKIEWIKTNISGDTPIHEVFSSKSPKKDLLIKWGEYIEELAKLGKYQKPLSTISVFVQEELKSMGLNEITEYVRKVYPAKWKDQTKDHSESDDDGRVTDHRETSSKDYKKDNKPYSSRLRDTAKLLQKAADKIDKQEFLKKLSSQELKDLEEFYVKWDNARDNLREVMDGREKVPVSKQYIFYYCAAQANTGHAYAMFVLHLRKFARFTPKQAGKIIEGKVKNMHMLYEPKDRMEALEDGFYGFPCDHCGSWRTKAKMMDEGLRMLCFKCGESSLLKTERLPDAQ